MVDRIFRFIRISAAATALVLVALRTQAEVGLEISRIGDASHVEFSGQQNWKYNLSKVPGQADRLTLLIPQLSREALAKLKGYSDSLIKSVSIVENGVDGNIEATFHLAPHADFFDYTTDQPSRLVVDFFPKEGVKAEPESKGKAKAAQANVAPVSADSRAKEVEKDLPAKMASSKQVEPEAHGESVVAETVASPTRKPAAGDFVLTAKGQMPGSSVSVARKLDQKSDQKSDQKNDLEHGIFDGADVEFKRFAIRDYEIREEALIASRANFYLPFPMLELGSPHLKALLEAPPIYEIVPSETQENKEAQLLLTLFTNKRRAVLLKTAAEFLKKYPKSPYDEIVRYMMADTRFALWKAEGLPADFETAMGIYRVLTERYPDSPLTPRTLLLMGYAFVSRGDSIGGLKTFQRFVRVNPNSRHADQVKISIAEAFLKLNRFDDAVTLLDEVEKNSKTKKAVQEAAFRKGDVFFRKGDFQESINRYRAAIAKYPDAAARYPNAWYNIAEAEFALERYRESLDDYRGFLQRFPDHEHGGYGMTRVGETLGILGADPKRAMGAFLESSFRYRSTPGAGVARIRALTGRMPEMKDKELASAIAEIEQITERYANRPKKTDDAKNAAESQGSRASETVVDKAGGKEGDKVAEKPAEHGEGSAEKSGGSTAEIAKTASHEIDETKDATIKPPELPGIEEFSTLLISDGYTERREFDKAVQLLVSFYQKNPQIPNKDKIRARIVRNLTEGIRAAVDKGDFIDALRRYSRNSSGWLKNNDRVDLYYNVAKAYEQAGVLKEATSIYQDSLKRLNAIKGTPGEKEHTVFEVLPASESIHLRLAVVAAKEKQFKEAEDLLKMTQGPLSDPEKIERAEVAAEVAEARGQGEVARKHLTDLIDTWKGNAELTSPLHYRIAQMQAKKRNFKEADASLAKIVDMQKSTGQVPEDILAKSLELRGDTLLARGKRAEAIGSYMELLESFEDKRPLGSIRYKVGQILYEDGDLKGAETAWSELKEERDKMWSNLAAEQMRSARWQEEYKKYINRIPAAVELKNKQSSSR